MCPEEKRPEVERKFSQELEDSSLIETHDINKIVDSSFSSTMITHIEPTVIPFGDILSVLTGSLASVRSL